MPDALDSKPDSPSNVLELFRAVAENVNQAFETQQLVPTEHAQLDDNGDGLGTEFGDLTPQAEQTEFAQPLVDGVRALRTAIRLRSTRDEVTPSSTDDTPLSSSPDPTSE